MNTLWLNTVDSTNSEALRRLGELPSGTVLAAYEQTAGRGQRGNRWFSEAGKNLTFSIVLKFPDGFLSAADAFLLNCLCSVSVVDFLASYGVSAQVKWPNDIYVGGRKICGMLLENGLSGASVAYSVMGLGINILQREFPNLANATSLALVVGGGEAASPLGPGDVLRPPVVDQVHFYPLDQVQHVADRAPSEPHHVDQVQCLDRFLRVFEDRQRQLDTPTGRRALFDEYETLLYRRGTSARYHDCIRDEDFEGILRGVEADGRLSVEDTAGTIRRFRFKELSFIL